MTLVGSIQKFSTEDGPGVRSTVFLKGCPLNCRWCHNPELINPEQQIIVSPNKCIGCLECEKVCSVRAIKIGTNGPAIDYEKCDTCGMCTDTCYAYAIRPVAAEYSVEEVFNKVVQDKEFYKQSGGGVTISGGELLLHGEFAEQLIRLCAKEKINVCLDTSGFGRYEILYKLACMENVEYVLYDMKHIESEKHEKYTGVKNDLIIENLEKLASDEKTAKKVWMRMPIIAGINDDEETILKTRRLFEKNGISRVTLMAYHDFGNSKAEHTGINLETFKVPSEERMEEIKEMFRSDGLDVEIAGREDAIA